MADNKSILVVDEDRAFRNSMAEILLQYDYEVVTAGSGEEAVEFFKYKRYDLFIIAQKLPGITGIDLLKILRTVAPEIGVIMVTLHWEMDAYFESKYLGALEYLTKQNKMSHLKETVVHVFSRYEAFKAVPV